MTDTTTAVSPLRSGIIYDMMLRNLSPATQRSYLHGVTKFSVPREEKTPRLQSGAGFSLRLGH